MFQLLSDESGLGPRRENPHIDQVNQIKEDNSVQSSNGDYFPSRTYRKDTLGQEIHFFVEIEIMMS